MINLFKKININHFLLLISFICIVVMFVYNLPYQDELAYAYKSGLRSGSYNVLERIGSLKDIIAQQIAEYQCSGNGRVIIHGILAFFTAAKLNLLFRIISVLLWYVFVYLILKNGKFEIKNSAGYLTGFLIVYWFLWYSETTCRDASYTINYLWCAVFFLACYGCWNSIKWWQVPLGFFLGASQETFALPVLCALSTTILIKLVFRKKFLYKISLQQICFVVGVFIGALFILSSPSAQGRANETIGSIFADIVKSGINMFIYFGSIVLLISSLGILIFHRKKITSVLMENLEWWLLVLYSLGMVCIIGRLGVRVMMPMMIGCLILVFRYKECFIFFARYKKGLLFFVFLWMVLGAVIQGFCGYNAYQTMKIYAEDSQGITYNRPVKTGIFVFTCYQIKWLNGTNKFLAADYNHSKRPTIFSEDIYKKLYIDQDSFLKDAKKFGGKFFVLPGNEAIVIKEGDDILDIIDRKILKEHFSAIVAKRNLLKKYIPQRIILAYPPKDAFALCPYPENRITFYNSKGNKFTAYFEPELYFE